MAVRIEQARRGDRAEAARLLTSLQDCWFRFCLGLLRDPDHARDATQETALRFLRQLSSFRGESTFKDMVAVDRPQRRPRDEAAGPREQRG